jgi:hypothetical protein
MSTNHTGAKNKRDVATAAPPTTTTAERRNGDDSYVNTFTPKQAVFSSAEFMKFLANEIDISKMIFETKDGQRISASFNGPTTKLHQQHNEAGTPSSGSSIFKSLDMLKSLESTAGNSIDPSLTQSTVSLEFFPSNSVDGTIKTGSGNLSSLGGSDPFSSREWAADFKSSHVEVSYSTAFGDPTNKNLYGIPSTSVHGDRGGGGGAGDMDNNGGSSSLPPKKRAASKAGTADGQDDNSSQNKTDWTAMFKNALKPLVDAASSVAEREPHHAPEKLLAGMKNGGSTVTSQYSSATKQSNIGGGSSRRKPRKIIPETKEYVKFTDEVILCLLRVVFLIPLFVFVILFGNWMLSCTHIFSLLVF